LCRFFDFAPRNTVAPGRPFGFVVANIDSGEGEWRANSN
jgi:hypothetical protein